MPAGVVHGFAMAAGATGWVLTVPIQTLPDLLEPAAAHETALGHPQILAASAPMAALFGAINDEHRATVPGRSAMLRALVAQAAYNNCRRHTQLP